MNPPMILRPDGPSEDSFAEPAPARSQTRARSGVLARPELLILLAGAALLYLWGLSKNGMANDYYAATVKSMSSNWHNFLYGSFDMNGVMTVDKPPLAFWVQALSVRAFGYGSWQLLVPQAMIGVASVWLTYDIVYRRFGRWAALAGGAVLALTPMTVAISRHNNPDALLILLSVAAIWFTIRALEDGRTRWIVLGGTAVGAAFTTKMGAALLVVPAIAAAYLWAAPVSRMRALGQLAIGGGVMVIVAGAWPLLVAVTPAASRPWISGTTDNSIWSLITQYNGLGRLDGQSGGPGGGMGGGGGGVFGGSTGITRLMNSALGPQVSWLLGFAIVGAVFLAVLTKLRPRDERTGWLIAVGGSFATIAIAFSYAKGIFHPYYSSLLAPFTAMLVGGGVGAFTAHRANSEAANGEGFAVGTPQARDWTAAAAILAALVTTLWALSNATADKLGAWQIVLGLICLSAAGALVFFGELPHVREAALIAALCALLVAPAIWSVSTLGHATSSTFPAGGSAASAASTGGPGGGPGGAGGRRGFGGPPPGAQSSSGSGQMAGPPSFGASQGGSSSSGSTRPSFSGGGPGGGAGGMFGGGNNQTLTAAIAYAKAHGGGTIGVESQSTAASVIAQSGADVAGIGGFSGRESTVSIAWLANRVADGQLRYFVTSGGNQGGPSDGRAGSTAAMDAVAKVCTAVTLSSTATTSTTTATNTNGSSSTSSGFYDCSGKAAALKALAS